MASIVCQAIRDWQRAREQQNNIGTDFSQEETDHDVGY
jgi:hypothetical protein